MAKFRKKPVVIEAWQFFVSDYQNHLEPVNAPHPAWLKTAFEDGVAWYQGGGEPHITIRTREGDMRADPGDWIIQGVKGELYPCKPDIFEATYDAEPETESQDVEAA
jgi:hypothetical protein